MPSNFRVTRRELKLGSRDSVTGWYEKNHVDSTIEMILIPRGATSMAVTAGVYVRLDLVGLTADPIEEGDEVRTDAGVFYEIKTVKKHWLADSFSHRECDLTVLPLHE